MRMRFFRIASHRIRKMRNSQCEFTSLLWDNIYHQRARHVLMTRSGRSFVLAGQGLPRTVLERLPAARIPPSNDRRRGHEDPLAPGPSSKREYFL